MVCCMDFCGISLYFAVFRSIHAPRIVTPPSRRHTAIQPLQLCMIIQPYSTIHYTTHTPPLSDDDAPRSMESQRFARCPRRSCERRHRGGRRGSDGCPDGPSLRAVRAAPPSQAADCRCCATQHQSQWVECALLRACHTRSVPARSARRAGCSRATSPARRSPCRRRRADVLSERKPWRSSPLLHVGLRFSRGIYIVSKSEPCHLAS